MKLWLDTQCKITQRELTSLSVLDLEREINERMNRCWNELMENKIKELLNKRPRYSKWIPKKAYLKFHTIEVIRWDCETQHIVWKWVVITQQNTVCLKKIKLLDLLRK